MTDQMGRRYCRKYSIVSGDVAGQTSDQHLTYRYTSAYIWPDINRNPDVARKKKTLFAFHRVSMLFATFVIPFDSVSVETVNREQNSFRFYVARILCFST